MVAMRDGEEGCPMSTQVQTVTHKRGFFGQIIKWGFIGFNVLMLIWVVGGLASVGEDMNNAASEAEQAGMAIGATLGLGFIASIWAAGAIIGGILVLLTRGKAVITTTDNT
jgi:hypothetical protein